MNNNRKVKVLEMLINTKTIAVIGMKDNEVETAYRIPYYMSKHGYKIYPVNPKNEGKKILGIYKHFENFYFSVVVHIDVINSGLWE
jgi:predicted CoA-binding protein